MSEVIPGKIYTHFKGGKFTVLHIVDDSTNSRVGTKGVVYISLTYGKIKYRDLDEFIESVVWSDGIERPRFILEEDTKKPL